MDVLIAGNTNKAEVHANVAPALHECVLSWCVKSLESSYWLGTYRENITEVWINKTVVGPCWSTIAYDDGSGTELTYLDNVTISIPSAESDPQDAEWGLSDNQMIYTTVIFDRLFPAFTTVANGSDTTLLPWRLGHPTEVRTRLLDFNLWLRTNNITRHIERLVTALTNAVRSDSASNEPVFGEAFSEETYITVHWKWLSFPLIMLGLSIVFLVATIFKTSHSGSEKIGIWKTSAMPTLLYSLPQDQRQQFSTAHSWRSAEGKKLKERRVKIKLMPKQGWRVFGQMAGTSVLLSENPTRPPPGWLK
ncbi:hypothetical protein EK21DRAFT_105940 [Setomelanomma holmii]|uniref:Uncharacterized protein n=1 Tax=Setomelanomma holmii TaxID=210430 RepID=A0A9P4HLR1_9PLEO|nr:hypothetical protein EK21DRAFT_105940 [Setomelanomma holmii]